MKDEGRRTKEQGQKSKDEGPLALMDNGQRTMDTKKGKLTTSHRYNLLPLLRSRPGGIQRELVV